FRQAGKETVKAKVMKMVPAEKFPQAERLCYLPEHFKTYLKSSGTWKRLKDCTVPAIGKMSGCLTTDFISPFARNSLALLMGRNIVCKCDKMTSDGKGECKQDTHHRAAFDAP